MSNVVAALRVKDEARWIARVLKSVSFCSEVIVFDDHSSDETPEICRAADALVLPSHFEGLDEARDKNFLLNWVRGFNPDWCLMIDGDEVLEAAGPERIRAAISCSEKANTCSYTLRVRYLWDSEEQERIDGIYRDFKRGSLFQVAGQPTTSKFKSTSNGGNFHCGNVPEGLVGKEVDLDVSLLHLGYLHQEDREQKFAFYNDRDKGNVTEDCYRHMVIGDLYPAESKFRYGGPLELRAFSA